MAEGGLQFVGNLEAGAGLVGKLVVAAYLCTGIALQEGGDELSHGLSLSGGSGVGSSVGYASDESDVAMGELPGGVGQRGQSADVADADAMGVVSLAVCSHLSLGPSGVDGSVAVDDPVVADGAEPSLTVPPGDVVDGVVASCRRGRAVQYDSVNVSHVVVFFVVCVLVVCWLPELAVCWCMS